jgi:hypothetical protein
MEQEKTQRSDIFVVPEDYILWQSVEKKVFDAALSGHAFYELRIRNTKIAILLGNLILNALFWNMLTFFSILILNGVIIYALRYVDSGFREIYRQKLESYLKDELALMRDILKRANLGKIDAVEVNSSPWINTRYLLRKKY